MIKKENIILIILVFVLVLGIFVSSNPDFVNEITGKFVGISGMQSADECIDNSDIRVINLRSKIQERIEIVKAFGGPNINAGNSLSEMRSMVINQLSQYYWNLDRVEPAPNNVFDDVNYKLIESDQPLAYSYTLNELFQQALGRDSWTNPDSNCIKEIDLTELKEVINKLEWISLQIGTGSTSRYSGKDMGIAIFSNMLKAEWYEERVGSDGSGYSNFDDSWSYTLDRFNSFASFPVYNNICPLKNYGNGHWISRYDRYYSEKFYNKCLIKYDFSSLPESIEIKEAKAYFFSPNYVYYTGNSVFDAIPAVININGEDHIIDVGYNLIEIDVSNKKGEIKLTPDLQQDVKPTITDKINYKQYDKGTKGSFLGVFVNVFTKNEPPIVEEVKFELDEKADILEKVKDPEAYKNEKVKIKSTGEEYKVVREYDEVNCNAVISDPDDKDNADGVLSAKARVWSSGGGHDIITGLLKTEWINMDCKFDKDTKKTNCKSIFIFSDYYGRYRGKRVQCEIVPKDRYSEGESEVSDELVVAANIYYFIPLNGNLYGSTKEQYDEDYHKISEVDNKLNSVGKPVFLKRLNKKLVPISTIAHWPTPILIYNSYDIRFSIISSRLMGKFDPSNDFIMVIISVDNPCGEGKLAGCFSATKNLYLIDYHERALTHGFGHIIGNFRDEYSIVFWYLNTLFGFTANVVGEDRTKHFPHCCFTVCCEIEKNIYKVRNSKTCPQRPIEDYILDNYYPHSVTDSLCNKGDLIRYSCGEALGCGGMPYKDGKPYDDSFDQYDMGAYSRMGSGGVGPFFYPEDARCPLRHC